MRSLRVRIALVVAGASLVLAAAGRAQISTGPFSPASPPFISAVGTGVQYLSQTQIKLDQNGDGIPDATFDLPPEIQMSGTGDYLIDARLSPTEMTLYSIKTPGSSPVAGCGTTDARIYFHSIGPPPSGLMALKYVAVTQPAGVVACLGLMVVVAKLTMSAYKRI